MAGQSDFALSEFFPYRLSVLSASISRAFSDVYAVPYDLTIPEWRILANLAHFGDMNAGSLAERSSMDKPKVTRALKRLVDKGLVNRSVAEQDRRHAVLTLTSSGVRRHREISKIALRWESELLAVLTPQEKRALAGALDKLQQCVRRPAR